MAEYSANPRRKCQLYGPARYSVARQKSFELASQSGGTAVLTRRYIAVVGVNAEFDWSYSGVNPDIGWC